MLKWRPPEKLGPSAPPVSAIQVSSNSKASAVSIRFVLCGAAKLYSFTLQVGDGRTHQEPIVSNKKDTAPASEEGASSNDELLPPYAESSGLHDLLGERDTLLSERWEKRAADLRSHAISYGRCAAELPIVQALVDAHQFGYEAWRNYVPCVGQRPLTCVFSMAAVADRPADAPSSPRWASRLVDLGHSRSIDGVIGCASAVAGVPDVRVRLNVVVELSVRML